MARNPDYQFIPTDEEEMVTFLVAAYEGITGKTVFPASHEMLFIRWIAYIILSESK